MGDDTRRVGTDHFKLLDKEKGEAAGGGSLSRTGLLDTVETLGSAMDDLTPPTAPERESDFRSTGILSQEEGERVAAGKGGEFTNSQVWRDKRRQGYLSNGMIAPFDARDFSPLKNDVGEVVDRRSQQLMDWVEGMEAEGFYNPITGTGGEIVPDAKFYTHVDLLSSFATGIAIDHRIAADATMAFWEENKAAVEQMKMNSRVNFFVLEESDSYHDFVQRHQGTLPQEVFDGITTFLDHNVDEAGIALALANVNETIKLGKNEGESDARFHNRILTEWVKWSGQAAIAYMQHTGQIEKGPGPGWREAWAGLDQGARGLFDTITPEERLGFEWGGEVSDISAGFGQALGFVANVPIIDEIFEGAYVISEGLRPYFHDPVSRWMKNWGSAVEDDPFREWMSEGQIAALNAGFEYGSNEYQAFSGVVDGITEIVTDPFTYLIPLGKATKIRSLVPLTEEMANMSRAARMARGLMPKFAQRRIFGKALPTNWSGPQGPVTRFFAYGMMRPIDDLLQSSTNKWGKMVNHAVEAAVAANGMDNFLEAYPFLRNSQGLVGVIEKYVPKVIENGEDAAEFVRQVVIDSFAGMPIEGKNIATTVAVAKGSAEEAERALVQRVNSAVANGEVAPRDLAGLRFGNSSYDGAVAFMIDDTGTARMVPLMEDGAKVTLLPQDLKIASMEDLSRLLDDPSTNPMAARLLGDAFSEGGLRSGELKLVWDDLGKAERARVTQWLHSQGFDGLDFGGNRVALTDEAIKTSVNTIDRRAMNNLHDVIGDELSDYLHAQRVATDLMSGSDNLTWIVETPFSSATSRFMKASRKSIQQAYDRAARAVVGDEARDLVQQARRRRTANMAAREQGFTPAVQWTDVNAAVAGVRQVGHRLGLDPEMVDDFARRVRNAETSGARRQTLVDIRGEMQDAVGDWKSQYINPHLNSERTFMSGKNNRGQSLARGKSQHGDEIVDKAFEPHMMNDRVMFFEEAYYGELARLTRARRGKFVPTFTKGLISDHGPIRGAKTRRAAIAARYQNMMETLAPDVARNIDPRDYYNMAYATVRDIGRQGDNFESGLGAISHATRYMGAHWKLAHSTFSIMALTLRAPGWMGKVVAFEEPIRGQLTGSTRWWSNPVGAFRETAQAHYVLKVLGEADMIPDVLSAMRSQVKGAVGAADNVAEALRIAQRYLDVDDLKGIDNMTDLAHAVDKATRNALNSFDPTMNGRLGSLGSVDAFAKKLEVLKSGRFRGLSEIEEFGMTLDDIMGLGKGRAAGLGDEISIYQNSIFDAFTTRTDVTRGYVPRSLTPEGIKRYSVAKGSMAIDEASDPWHRFAIEYHLAVLEGTPPPSIQEFMLQGKWQNLRENIASIADHNNVKWRTDADLANWYVREFQRDIIETRWGGLWNEFETTKIEVLRGVLDKEISVEGIRIPLVQSNEAGSIAGYAKLMEKAAANGQELLSWEAEVIGSMRLERLQTTPKNWRMYNLMHDTQRTIFEKTRLVGRVDPDTGRNINGMIQWFGSNATNKVNRLPGWRNMYTKWRRTFEEMGWDATRADAGARLKATQSINNIFYNGNDMPKVLQAYNGVVPFGAAAFEVAKVWMHDIPKYLGGNGMTGWTLGAVDLGRRWNYIVQAMEATGLVQMVWNERDQVWDRKFVLDDDSDSFINRGLFAAFNGPAQLVASVVNGLSDADLDGFARIEFNVGSLTGNPLAIDNDGLFSVANFQVGMSPPAAFAIQSLAPSLVGRTERITTEGTMVVSEFLAEHDIELDEFLSLPENRARLREKGFPLGEVNEIIRTLREDPENIENLEHAAALGGILDFELPAGTYALKNAGAELGAFQNYMFPFGAPSSIGELIGDFAPSNIQNALMGIEALFRDGDVGTSEFFFGPTAAYNNDSAFAIGMMTNMVADGTLGEMQEAVQAAADLRLEAVEKGWANFDGEDGDRFRWDQDALDNIEEAEALALRVQGLNETIGGLQEAVAGDAVVYSAGHHFQRALTQTISPISPRIFRTANEQQEIFWGARDFAEGIRNGHGEAAYTRWVSNMSTSDRLNDSIRIVAEFLAPPVWDPGADDRQKAYWTSLPTKTDVSRAIRENPHLKDLWIYITPTKVYPNGYVPMESMGEWADAVKAGDIMFDDPKVFFMRALREQSSYDLAVSRAAFWEEGEDWSHALTNYDEYQALSEAALNVFDYLDVVDGEVFENAYTNAAAEAKEVREGKQDVRDIIRQEVQEDLERHEQMLYGLLDDIEKMTIDPTEARELESAIHTLIDEVDRAQALGISLEEWGVVHPFEKSLREYKTAVVAPYYEELGKLYSELASAESDLDRSLIFERVRQFENKMYKDDQTVDGVTVPSAQRWALDKMVREAEANGVKGSKLEQRGLRSFAGKLEWMSQYDIDVLAEYVGMLPGGKVDNMSDALPHTAEQWLPFAIHAEAYREIEAGRLSGELSSSEAKDLKDAYDEVLLESVPEATRQFMEATPAMQMDTLGILPQALFPLVDTANEYLSYINELTDAKIRHNKKDLWLQDTWPLMAGYLDTHPEAKNALRNLGIELYKTNDLADIGYRFFLGKFADV